MNYDPSEVKKLREQHTLLQAKCAELQAEVDQCRERLGPAGMEVLRLANWAHRHGMPALASIVQHSWAAEKPKWGNEFVEIAKKALEYYPGKSPVQTESGEKE